MKPTSRTDAAAWLLDAIDSEIPFGPSRNNAFEHATAAQAVADRARIGIRRGFLSPIEAGSLSCLDAARSLREMCEQPELAGRFFPSYPIVAPELFADHALGAYTALVQGGPPALFRLWVEGRQDWWKLGIQMLREIAGDRPQVVQIATRGLPSLDLVIRTAHENPQMRFILTAHSWGQDAIIHTAMSEAGNILSDTSFGHTQDHIDLLADRYGVGRVVLSLGPRALGGASLGFLQASTRPKRDKLAILGGNLSKLLNLPKRKAEPASPLPESLWKTWLQQGNVGTPIIDAHGHLGPTAQWVLKDQSEQMQIPRKSAAMNRESLRYFIFSHSRALFSDPLAGNAIAEKQVIESGDPRYLAYFVFNPLYAERLIPYLHKVPRSRIFIGFKLLNDYWQVRVDDPRIDPMWEVANAHHLPVLIHTWGGPYNSPAMLGPLAQRFPNVRFLLAHCGGNDAGREEAEAVVAEHPNAYLEWCGSFLTSKPWEETIARVGSHKLIFGTDGIYHCHHYELARLLSAPLPPEAFQRILHDNMARLIEPLLPQRDLCQLF